MRALQSRFPPKRRLSAEWHRTLQLLADNPRGTTEHVLVLGHGFSGDTLAMLMLAGLATAATETLGGGQGKIERMSITDAGRRALEGRPK
jgi:hypothetical protein